MHLTKTAAVAISALALSAGAGLAASAAPAAGTFHSTLKPAKITVGHTFRITSTSARPSTTYNCIEIVTKGTAYGYDLATLKQVKSGPAGHVTCSSKYVSFKATVGSTVRHCPQTKADLRAHVKCGVAVSTTDQTSNTAAYFSSVKK